MKILLVYPEFPDTYWSFSHALKFEGKRSAFPPLGLLTVSAMLPHAWKRRLVDMNVRQLTDTDIGWADMIFLSAMIVQKESLREVVSLCKARGKRVVVGGPYVTTSTANMPEADHVFVGEAETTLPEFARDLTRGNARRIYQAAERREFWRFMREVILSHRERFADAVMLAAMGYHFRKITELYCGPPQPA